MSRSSFFESGLCEQSIKIGFSGARCFQGLPSPVDHSGRNTENSSIWFDRPVGDEFAPTTARSPTIVPGNNVALDPSASVAPERLLRAALIQILFREQLWQPCDIVGGEG
jgi:hypothetical protein